MYGLGPLAVYSAETMPQPPGLRGQVKVFLFDGSEQRVEEARYGERAGGERNTITDRSVGISGSGDSLRLVNDLLGFRKTMCDLLGGKKIKLDYLQRLYHKSLRMTAWYCLWTRRLENNPRLSRRLELEGRFALNLLITYKE